MKYSFFFLTLLIPFAANSFKSQYDGCHNNESGGQIVSSLINSNFWDKKDLNDSVYTLLLMYFENPSKSAEYAETMNYYVYKLFENESNAFARVFDKIQCLPDIVQRKIKEQILDALLGYEEQEFYDQYLYQNTINADSVKLYNDRFRKKFPNSFLLFPQDTRLFEYLIDNDSE